MDIEKPTVQLNREALIIRIQEKLNQYHNDLASDNISLDKHENDIGKIIRLGKRIKTEIGIDPQTLVFWHKLIGSTMLEEMSAVSELDTPNKDIEKLINELIQY